MVKNSAFVFLKPHAITDKVKEVVKATLEEKGLTIKSEGSIEAEEIDKKMLIDKHYYAIASKATLLTPDKLNVPKEKFKDQFGADWDETLKDGKIFNARGACEKLEVDAMELDTIWAKAKKEKSLVKFGGGFYCAKVSKGDTEIFCMNGFFMSMRSKFVEAGASIYYYVVEWDSASLNWADFRGKVLGPTDPADAPKDSLRGMVLAKWKELGLKEVPNVGDNAVHASASPFEALAERMNWLSFRPDRDPFGKLMLKAGISRKVIKDWSNDPQVTFGALPMTKSLFDSLEDTDTDYCLALCQMIAASAPPSKEDKQLSPLEKEVEELRKQVAAYEEVAKAVRAIQDFVPVAPAPKKAAKAKAKAKTRAKKDKKKRGGSGDMVEE